MSGVALVLMVYFVSWTKFVDYIIYFLNYAKANASTLSTFYSVSSALKGMISILAIYFGMIVFHTTHLVYYVSYGRVEEDIERANKKLTYVDISDRVLV